MAYFHELVEVACAVDASTWGAPQTLHLSGVGTAEDT